jgi:glycosyltransferase involved in cell wall biosynthesis
MPDIDSANRLADHARRISATLLFDLDDDLLNVPATHPDAAMHRPLARVVRRMLAVADSVWVSTPGLAARLASIRPDATVIENRLDERIWSAGPAPSPFWDDPVRILCMGTTTHERDFALIEPALLRLKAEYGGHVVIDVLGMTSRIELPAELNRIGPSTHASRSYPGFVNWLTTMQPRWHIGLAPLLDTAFNRSKSPIKAMDYAALGLTVLASDVPAYRGSIADGPAGQLVANDPANWHAAIDWLIRNQALRESLMVQARQAFLGGATLASHADIRLAAWQRLLPARLREASAALTMPHGSTDSVARTRRHSGRGR